MTGSPFHMTLWELVCLLVWLALVIAAALGIGAGCVCGFLSYCNIVAIEHTLIWYLIASGLGGGMVAAVWAWLVLRDSEDD